MHAQACGLGSLDVSPGDLIRPSVGNETRVKVKVQWAQVTEALALARAATRLSVLSDGANYHS